MGLAKEYLSISERDRIARELLSDAKPAAENRRFTSACPFHLETTPGGAFWYDPEKDQAVCYSCGNFGDLIDIYCVVNGYAEGQPEGIRAFLERYVPERDRKVGNKTKESERAVSAPKEWTPKRTVPSPESWREKATEFVDKRNADLMDNKEALALLARWGIKPETAARVKLGWNPEKRFYRYTAWGLPYAENATGRERCIHAPAGLVIPCYQREEGRHVLKRVKIRCSDPDAAAKQRYVALVGGEECYAVWGDPAWKIWVVVETERDAVLLWQELARYGIGAMGTGSAGKAPDPVSHAILSRADCIVNALDNDRAGAKASWKWLPDHRFAWSVYPHAIRWLVPSVIGKDVGDLPAAGIGIWEWLRDGLPSYIRREAERNATRKRLNYRPFPAPEDLSCMLSEKGMEFYVDAYGFAKKYGLLYAINEDDIVIKYQEGFDPYLDADQYVAMLLRGDPSIIEALGGAGCPR